MIYMGGDGNTSKSGKVNVIPTLRKFRGGPVEAFLGGASLEGRPS